MLRPELAFVPLREFCIRGNVVGGNIQHVLLRRLVLGPIRQTLAVWIAGRRKVCPVTVSVFAVSIWASVIGTLSNR